jgi:outer membrane protein assembly factor BamA
MSRIEKDKEFLKSCYLMDYSLLLIFFKKQDITDTESYKNRKLSIFVKKGEEGNILSV